MHHFLFVFPYKAKPAVEPFKRGRTGSSSLLPFPRVGRSVDQQDAGADDSDRLSGAGSSRLLFGQKRTGKSSLIPFPRVGRRSDPLWSNMNYRGTPPKNPCPPHPNYQPNIFMLFQCWIILIMSTYYTNCRPLFRKDPRLPILWLHFQYLHVLRPLRAPLHPP